ncbi:efflux RND transporter periplasmic adaptor subunit [Panacibacter ginsenosidivorans]|uniref:Efflux RND transporter periplasmic adaptor subunit n=1 Tax=Panacibacter ginsenosidivorans TaxID=1813871 RepID=A0A5B8VF56_9BACT|nr:efflux RND transporter periplasmic adaptor subunit [Panacibacter ginsenosidivorans]QEC70217.1 efflux RND transporter periplasmic adaptor subunit [Panacibacter ginsenosidivorans]
MQRFIALLFITTLFFFSCKSKKQAPQTPPASPPVEVDVIVAAGENISNSIEVNGTVVANESAELRPEISGRLTYLNVPEGKPVQQGTVLARINSADLEAQISKSKVQLDLAQQTEERLRKLLDIHGVNQADYDAALNNVNSLKADINYTEALIDKTVIRAPFTGVIGLRQVSPGAYVTPANIIATIQQVNKLKIDFTLPEAYANAVQRGAYIDVLTDEATGKKEKALIIATEPQVDINTRNLKVRAVLESSNANPGSFVKVYVVTGKDRSSVMVPTNAIIPDAMNKKIGTVKNGKAKFVDVETGVRKQGTIEVTKGVQAGDTIIVSGVLFARPNLPVQIRAVKKIDEVVEH